MCLNETYRRVRVGKYLSDMFPIRNDLKEEDISFQLFCHYAIRRILMKQMA